MDENVERVEVGWEEHLVTITFFDLFGEPLGKYAFSPQEAKRLLEMLTQILQITS